MKNKASRNISLALIAVAIIMSLIECASEIIDLLTALVRYSGSSFEYELFSVIRAIISAFGIIFLTVWAVRSRDRKYPILGSIYLIIATFIDYYFDPLGLHLPLLFAFAVLLIFSFLGFRHKKVLFVILLIAGVVYGISFVRFSGLGWELFAYVLSHTFLSLLYSIWFILYSIFILLGGQPLDQDRPIKRVYIPSKTENISSRLNKIKSDYESGKITEDDYQNRRMELLKKISKKK